MRKLYGSLKFVAEQMGISRALASRYLDKHHPEAVKLLELWLSKRELEVMELNKAKSELLNKQKRLLTLMKG